MRRRLSYMMNLAPLTHSASFMPLAKNASAICRETLADELLLKAQTPYVFDWISDVLSTFMDTMEVHKNLHLLPLFRSRAAASYEFLGRYMSQLNGNLSLYRTLNKYRQDNCDRMTIEESTIVSVFLRDFEIHGVALPLESRRKIAAQHAKIVQLQSDLIAAHATGDAEIFVISLQNMLVARHQLAASLGFSSYAAYFLADKSLLNAEKVVEFLNEASTKSSTYSYSDDWEISLDNFMIGLCELMRDVYGLHLSIQKPERNECWNDEVIVIRVNSGKFNAFMGTIYLDWLVNSHKPLIASHFTVLTRKNRYPHNLDAVFEKHCSKNGLKRLAMINDVNSNGENSNCRPGIVCISTSFDKSAILSKRDCLEALHEFGHAIHSLATESNFQSASGTRTKLDFVEIPSIFNEFFVNSKYFLLKCKPVTSKTRIECDTANEQLKYSFIDQAIHSSLVENYACDTTDKVWIFTLIEHWIRLIDANNHFSAQKFNIKETFQIFPSIAHLIGYGAGYYSYSYCNFIAKNIWNRMHREDGTLDISQMQNVYFDKFLAAGGSVPARVLIDGVLSP